MPTSRQLLGQVGEDLTARWYLEHGYEVVARNWRCPYGEADIIARRQRLVVVCEVKTRSDLRFGTPAEAVTQARQARLRRTASAYLQDRAGLKESAGLPFSRGVAVVRFDVAEVMYGTVSVIEAAF